MYYISRYAVLLFILGVVWSMSSAARASPRWNAPPRVWIGTARERIWQREMSLLWFWRGPDLAGMALIVLGVLRSLGLLPLLPRGWGVPLLAAGLVVLSLSSSLRAWLRSGAYSAEAPGNAVARSAFRAGVVVTAAELALAGVVCCFVLARYPSATRAGSAPPAPTVVAPEETSGKADLFWVDEAEALNLLKGKDAAYLDALVRRKDIRSKTEDGRKLYRRDDISALKMAGLPNLEELQEDLKNK